MRVFLAGKIVPHCWRHSIVEGLHGALRVSERPGGDVPVPVWPVLRKAIFREHDYVGPFFLTSHQNCYHGANQHGSNAGGFFSYPDEDATGITTFAEFPAHPTPRQVVSKLCLDAIATADVVFAWVDDPTAYGTIYELGYARAKGIFTAVAFWRDYPDLWFPFASADWQRVWGKPTGTDRAPSEMLKDAIAAAPPFILYNLALRDYTAYLRTPHWQALRSQALGIALNRCATCNGKQNLQVHHRTYDRLGRESISDLIVLCASCHGLYHGKLCRGLPRP